MSKKLNFEMESVYTGMTEEVLRGWLRLVEWRPGNTVTLPTAMLVIKTFSQELRRYIKLMAQFRRWKATKDLKIREYRRQVKARDRCIIRLHKTIVDLERKLEERNSCP